MFNAFLFVCLQHKYKEVADVLGEILIRFDNFGNTDKQITHTCKDPSLIVTNSTSYDVVLQSA